MESPKGEYSKKINPDEFEKLFEAAYTKFRAKMLSYCLGWLSNSALDYSQRVLLAEDMISTVVINFYKNKNIPAEVLEDDNKTLAYFKKSLNFAFLRYFNSQNTKKRKHTEDFFSDKTTLEPKPLEIFVGSESDELNKLLSIHPDLNLKQIRLALTRMSNLTDDEKKVLSSLFFKDKGASSIAKELATNKSEHLKSALKKLKEFLKNFNFDLTPKEHKVNKVDATKNKKEAFKAKQAEESEKYFIDYKDRLYEDILSLLKREGTTRKNTVLNSLVNHPSGAVLIALSSLVQTRKIIESKGIAKQDINYKINDQNRD